MIRKITYKVLLLSLLLLSGYNHASALLGNNEILTTGSNTQSSILVAPSKNHHQEGQQDKFTVAETEVKEESENSSKHLQKISTDGIATEIHIGSVYQIFTGTTRSLQTNSNVCILCKYLLFQDLRL